ncbi:MAG: hypothetical protein RSB41_00720 [Bacilli bacterium]
MKDIKLQDSFNKCYRAPSVEGYVNVNEVEFIEGIALVNAYMVIRATDYSREVKYRTWGLIDSDYNELLPNNRVFNRYLSFIMYNKIKRIATFDFIVIIDNKSYHLKLDKLNNSVSSTYLGDKEYNISNFIISGDTFLYNVNTSKFILKDVSNIKIFDECSEDDVTYLVTDNILYSDKATIYDTFLFLVNSVGDIITPIYSKNGNKSNYSILNSKDYQIYKESLENEFSNKKGLKLVL